MARNYYCIPCGERGQGVLSTVVIDGDPMCSACARDLQPGYIQKAAEVEIDAIAAAATCAPVATLCSRGCGKPTHRGLCKGSGGRPHQVRQKSKSRAAEREKRFMDGEGKGMDKLVSREIALEEIPVSIDPHRVLGRSGELWAWLRDANPIAALEVVCRDREHVRSTHHPLLKKAQNAAIPFYWSRIGGMYYISKSPFKGGRKAWE
jgi:hypothetical protein